MPAHAGTAPSAQRQTPTATNGGDGAGGVCAGEGVPVAGGVAVATTNNTTTGPNTAPAGGTATSNANDSGKACLQSSKTILKTVNVFLATRRLHQDKMDELSGKINPKQLEALRKKTKFTKDELDALCRIYRKLVSNCQYAAKKLAAGSSGAAIVKPYAAVEGIDRIVFRELLHSTFDIVTEELLMERIFCNWDKAHEGLPLRLEGWVLGLSVFLRGTLAERAAFCFRIYDLNADGYITKDEMFTLLRNCLIKQPHEEDPDESVKDLVEIVLKKFDLDKDGKVSMEDFLGTVEAQPMLIEAFGQCLPTESAVVTFFSTLQV